jgi:hypothetical protein
MAVHSSPRIWHVGNWCIHLGQTYVESPFKSEKKDVELLNYAQPFVDALKNIPGSEVLSQPSWDLYHLSPEAFDERLCRLSWASTKPLSAMDPSASWRSTIRVRGIHCLPQEPMARGGSRAGRRAQALTGGLTS